jgi:predicted outer membrane repeat protein
MRLHSRPSITLVIFLVISVVFGATGWAPNIVLADLADPPPPQTPAEELGVTEPLSTANDALPEGSSLENSSDPDTGRVETPTPDQEPVIDWITADRTVGAGCTYPTIAAAITASTPGDRLLIEGGVTFNEAITVNKNLTLQGGYSGCASGSSERSTINAGGAGSVVIVDAGLEASLTNLNLTNGNTGFEGGGIRFAYGTGTGTLHLNDVHIYNNNAQWGGGIWIGPDAQVIASDIEVYNNTATTFGGGVRLFGSRLFIENSNIHDNTAPLGGGVYGTLENTFSSVLDLTSTVNISDNQALTGDGQGGGVFLREGTFILAGGSAISSNDALQGGGVYLDNSDMDAVVAFIYGNTATYTGAGLYATASTLSLAEVNVGGTQPDEPNTLGPDGNTGAGLYLTGGTIAMLEDSLIAGNVFQTTGFTYGGGAYLTGNSELTLTRSRVEGHTAPSSTDGRGAGLYLNNATVTLDDSHIENNTAGAVGGGIRLWGTSTLTIQGGSSLTNNSSLNDVGGAIAASGTPTINISDSLLGQNSAATHGGAIYINAGTLDFSGGWTLRENTAGGSGGAVAALGSATTNFRAGRYSLVYFNRAQGGHGGFLYLGSATTARLYATAGAQMYVYANHASDNGGALYADNNGYFDIYGQVAFDRNRADHGGAIYLSNGSRVWLDDYVNDYPQLWDNFADYGSGGAIYAVDSPSVRCDGAIFGQSDDGNHAAVSGGAIYLDNSALIAENCTFQANQAQDHGGAIAAFTSTLTIKANLITPVSLAMERERASENLATLEPAATIRDPLLGYPSRFRDNIADNDGNNTGAGGAIYLSNSSLQMDQTVLNGNSAYYGGAIYQSGAASVSEVRNSLVYSNTVSLAFGAGIRKGDGAFTVRHVTLANNIGGSGFSGVADGAYNSIAWGNDGFPGFSTAPLDASCNIDDGGNTGIDMDPLFISPRTNYNLLPGSPAIDACATGLPVDLIARARPVGAGYDMGAYEWTNLLPAGLHEGSVGTVGRTGCNVSGWAMDPNVPDREVQVRVLSDSIQVATGSATLYRADLEDSCPGGTCAFTFDLWGLVSAGLEHAITVQAYDEEIDGWSDLDGTPKSLTCWGYPEGQHEGDEGFGGITTCRAVGWVGDPDDPTRDVTVRVEVDGAPVETVTANQYREGLDPLLCPGGTCAFTVDLWGRVPFNVENTITVRAYDVESDDWYDLAGTPKTLTCRAGITYLPFLIR